jgi:hypothetical protein
MPGTKLVVGNRDLAKVWDITRDEQGFKYEYLVQVLS